MPTQVQAFFKDIQIPGSATMADPVSQLAARIPRHGVPKLCTWVSRPPTIPAKQSLGVQGPHLRIRFRLIHPRLGATFGTRGSRSRRGWWPGRPPGSRRSGEDRFQHPTLQVRHLVTGAQKPPVRVSKQPGQEGAGLGSLTLNRIFSYVLPLECSSSSNLGVEPMWVMSIERNHGSVTFNVMGLQGGIVSFETRRHLATKHSKYSRWPSSLITTWRRHPTGAFAFRRRWGAGNAVWRCGGSRNDKGLSRRATTRRATTCGGLASWGGLGFGLSRRSGTLAVAAVKHKGPGLTARMNTHGCTRGFNLL